jgi:hypothetical protein
MKAVFDVGDRGEPTALVAGMHGPHRLSTLIRLADRLGREAAPAAGL